MKNPTTKVKKSGERGETANMEANPKTVLFLSGGMGFVPRRRLAGIREVAGRESWFVAMVSVPGAGQPRRILADWKPDGAIVEGYVLRNRGWNASVFDEAGVPVVFCDADRRFVTDRHFGVRHDSRETARCAMRELLALGLPHYAYVHHLQLLDWSRDRETVFREELAATGLAPHVFRPASRTSACDIRRHFESIAAFLAALPTPCGVLAANDETASLVLLAAARCGLSVPWDLAVASIDNDIDICETVRPTLTSVAPAFIQSGRLAATLLKRRLDDPALPPETLVFGSAPLARRQSTDRTVRRDPKVARAQELIRKKACEGLAPPEVVKSMGLGTRSAEIRFRNATGKSIRRAILAARVARAMALLSEPRRDPVSVFVECGWCDEHAFRRAFVRETGFTPLRWRRLHLGK